MSSSWPCLVLFLLPDIRSSSGFRRSASHCACSPRCKDSPGDADRQLTSARYTVPPKLDFRAVPELFVAALSTLFVCFAPAWALSLTSMLQTERPCDAAPW